MRRKLPAGFWSRVEFTETCWLWRGKVGSRGYGGYQGMAAHRVAYARTIGPIPPGALICHTCDVKICVRPGHLYAGDDATNRRDAFARGRAFTPWRANPPMKNPTLAALVAAKNRARNAALRELVKVSK